MALGAGNLEVIDPVLADPDFCQDVTDSLRRAEVLDRVILHSGYSPAEVERLSREAGKRWSLVFIDGDHEGEAPRKDAEVVHRFSSKDAMIVLHDLSSPDVAAALSWLRAHSWDTYIYQTMQIMGVAVRGSAKPIIHLPDPSQRWTLPSHLASFPIIGETRRERLHRIVAAVEGRPPPELDAQSSGSSLDSLPQQDAAALDELLAYIPSGSHQADVLHAFDALQSKHLELQRRYTDLESRQQSITGNVERAQQEAAAAVERAQQEAAAAVERAQQEAAAAAAAQQNALHELGSVSRLFELLQRKYLDLLQKLGDAEIRHQTMIQQVNEARRDTAAAVSAHQEALNLLQTLNDTKYTDHALIPHVEDARREADAAVAAHEAEDQLRGAIRRFAFCIARRRVLFGLFRRLLIGRTQEVRRIVERMLRDHGIPHNLTHSATWLARPRAVFGLVRRRALVDTLSIQGYVALALERSFRLLPDSASVMPLSSGTAALRLMQVRLCDIQRWLERGAPIPDLSELQHLRMVISDLQQQFATAQGRVGELEEQIAKALGRVDELEEQIAKAQRRFAALEEAKLTDEKALLEADLTIARLRKSAVASPEI
jgi:hypothetical protein